MSRKYEKQITIHISEDDYLKLERQIERTTFSKSAFIRNILVNELRRLEREEKTNSEI